MKDKIIAQIFKNKRNNQFSFTPSKRKSSKIALDKIGKETKFIIIKDYEFI